MRKRRIRYTRLGGRYTERDLAAVVAAVRHAMAPGGDFFPQPDERRFQEALARREGAARAVATSSCGTALDACMIALDVGPGDEVITTPLTFVCTASTALARGARVVFADVDPQTLNLDPASVERRLSPRTKAILPVHLAGLPCDLDAFDRIAASSGAAVVYDAAHALGARQGGRPIGGRGTATCYSFQFHKTITCLGEGGAVLTDDVELAERIRQLRTFGYVYPREDSYEGGSVESIGVNYQMGAVQYAVGLTQLEQLDLVLRDRRARMRRVSDGLADVAGVIRPPGHGDEHGSLLYIIQVDPDVLGCGAEAFRQTLLADFGVETGKHYVPLWALGALKRLGYTAEGCPVAARVSERTLTLPVSPQMPLEDCDYLAFAVRETAAALRDRHRSPAARRSVA